MRVALPLLVLSLALRPLAAQMGPAEHVALGDSAHAALHPDQALRHYQAALATEPGNYGALWRAARSIADVAKQIEGNADSLKRKRDSLYTVGRDYAERAVKADSTRAEGHYVVAMVLGRLSRTKGSKERVRFAKIIYDEAARAVQIDSTHDGAQHVLGAWHAEVKRLSGIQRFFAKALFGGGFMGVASWDSAVVHLQRAVALKPDHIYHRLELAGVYIDLDRYTDARALLTSIAALPVADVMDPTYKREAVEQLDEIRDKKDKT